jgi:transposase
LTQISSEWFERYSHPLDEYRLPKEKVERLALAEQIGKDGQWLLLRIMQSEAATWLEKAPAIMTLRRVWEQQYESSSFPDPVAPYGEPASLKRTHCLPS